MAVKASAQITLNYVVDVQGVYRYYLLQSSTASKPSKPTTFPPSSSWSDAEPTYTAGSTNSLYFVDCTILCDGTFTYSEVSLSSSYEASKTAYNKAQNAQDTANTANNKIDNLEIGGRNLLLNSGLTDNFDKWVIGSYAEIISIDGVQCAHIAGALTSVKHVSQDILSKINTNDLSQEYTFSADIRMDNYVAGTTNPYIKLLFDGRYDNNGTSTWMGASNVTAPPDLGSYSGDGWVRVSWTVKFSKVPTEMRVYIYARDFTGDLYFKNLKLELGNRATDWSPAPEDIEGKIEEVSSALDASTDVIVGTQTATTGSWTGVAKFSTLKDGQRIAYWLPYNGSGNATLNLTLSTGATTGAIACYYSGTSRITTHYPAGNVIHLTYRENVSIAGSSTKYTGWWADANYDSGNTYDRVRYTATIIAGDTAIVGGNLIVAKDGTYTHLKLGNAFDVTYPILYAGSNISASATGNNNYLAIPMNVSYTQSITLTAHKPVYIKGKLSGSLFTPVSTTPLTQTVPTSADGYQYILLGTAYASSYIYLLNEHPIFQYYNGAFKTVQQIAIEAASNIDNLEVGGRNYVTKLQDNTSTGNGITVDRTEFNFHIYGTNTKTDAAYGISIWTERNEVLEPGAVYTISTTEPMPTGLYLGLNTKDSSGTQMQAGSGTYTNAYFYGDGTTKSHTFTCSPESNGYATGFFGITKDCGTIDVEFRIKLEKGNRATDWSPAPEDIDQSITDTKNELNESINEVDKKASAAIDVLKNQIAMLVTGENGESLMTQTDTGWTFNMKQYIEQASATSVGLGTVQQQLGTLGGNVGELSTAVQGLSTLTSYIRLDRDGNIPYIELGAEGSQFKVRITNTDIKFFDGTSIPAYISNESLNIDRAIVDDSIKFGGHAFKIRPNGNLGIYWEGE